jgi:hypothetical protein
MPKRKESELDKNKQKTSDNIDVYHNNVNVLDQGLEIRTKKEYDNVPEGILYTIYSVGKNNVVLKNMGSDEAPKTLIVSYDELEQYFELD